MMSGHDPNPIFFNNKKMKIGRPEHSLTPHPPASDNISFLPYPPTPHQSGRHMCITPKVVLVFFKKLSKALLGVGIFLARAGPISVKNSLNFLDISTKCSTKSLQGSFDLLC